jgi:hypothetical protein
MKINLELTKTLPYLCQVGSIVGLQFKIKIIHMYNPNKVQALITIFDGMPFEVITATYEWDELSCAEQQAIEEHLL